MPGGDGWTVKGGQFTRDGGGGAELRSDGESGHELRGLVYPPRVGGGVADSNRYGWLRLVKHLTVGQLNHLELPS